MMLADGVPRGRGLLCFLARLDPFFAHQVFIQLSQARHDRLILRFRDFKFVDEYNSEVCRIQFHTQICNEVLTNRDFFEKDLLHLQQQHQAQNFKKKSNLIFVYQQRKKNYQLLMKNYQSKCYPCTSRPKSLMRGKMGNFKPQ